MRIGIDCRMYSSNFTGIGRYVHELTRNLFRIDKDNEYILFFNNPEFGSFIPPNKKVTKILADARHYSFAEQTKFLHLLNKAKLDLMHFTHFNAPLLYRRPSVVTIHDLTLSFYPGKKMTSPLHRLAYHLTIGNAVKSSRKVITVSQNTKKDIQNLLKIPAQKIEVIYEGIDSGFRRPEDENIIARTKNRLNIDKPYLLYTGVWRSHKNLPNLLKAFHILVNEYDFDGYLVVTGRKDPLYESEILTQTKSLRLEDNVIFTGMVEEEELVALYCGALSYVFPSYYEGFGLSPLEAMACGTPVAASDRSCIPEICGKDNAVFFDPDSPEQMAEKIFDVISQKSLREHLIKNGLNRVKTFSWEKMAIETLKVYDDILNGSSKKKSSPPTCSKP